MATIEPTRLLQDELIFELQIRGISNPSGNADELRKTLRDMLRMEKLGKSFKLYTDGLEFDTEVQICESKYKEALAGVNAFDGSENQWRKWTTRITHLLGRIEFLEPPTAETALQRSHLLQNAVKIFGTLTDKHEEAKKRAQVADLRQIDPVLTSTPTTSQTGLPSLHQSTIISAGRVSTDDGNANVQGAITGVNSPPFSVGRGSIPVYKWGLKFTGEIHHTSLNAFLEQVEDFRLSRAVDKEQLYQAASELFEGKAKSWYRAVRRNITSWDELVVELKREFQPMDYTERLWEEIKSRIQGPHESIGMYLANMSNLFSRLAITVPDETRIRIMRKNILPYFQDQLALVDIHSEHELLELCRKLEAHRSQVRNCSVPSTSTSCLEPDLSYVEPQQAHVNAVTEVRPKSTAECWNCRKSGHLAKNCRAPRRKHCFSCGAPDVIKTECPKCSKGRKPSNAGNGKEIQSQRAED